MKGETKYFTVRGEGALLHEALLKLEGAMNDNLKGRVVHLVGPVTIVQNRLDSRWHAVQSFMDMGEALFVAEHVGE